MAARKEPVRWIGLVLNVSVAAQQAMAGDIGPWTPFLAGLIAALTELARERVTPV